MGNRKFGIIFLLFLASCTTVQQPTNPDKIYRRDMLLEVNGLKGNGVMVVPKAAKYEFKIEARGTLDMLVIKSCHEHKPIEKAKEDGMFGSKRKTKFTYEMGDVELSRSACPLELGGFEKTQGRHSWALVDFESDTYQLPAVLYCNGETSGTNGVSLCQSQAGLIQRIVFDSEVDVASQADEKCTVEVPKEKTFEWKIRPDICVYNFIEKQKPHRFHRLTTIGYEEIIIRGEAEQ